MAHTVILKSIKDIDLSIFCFLQVAVFNRPKDYPDKAVARIFDNGCPTNVVMVADEPETLKEDVCKNTTLMWFPRGKDDHESVVGVYM